MKFTLLFCLFFSLGLSAAELKMATIKSDVDSNTTLFLMEVDASQTIHSIRIKTTTPTGKIFEDFSYSSEEVMKEGAVLRTERGHIAVRLEADEKFSITQGGTIALDYLVSGISGSRNKMLLKLLKVNNQFVLQKMSGEPVNNFYFKGNWHKVLGCIGIKEIILSQQL